jgi:hypothetical protein
MNILPLYAQGGGLCGNVVIADERTLNVNRFDTG